MKVKSNNVSKMNKIHTYVLQLVMITEKSTPLSDTIEYHETCLVVVNVDRDSFEFVFCLCLSRIHLPFRVLRVPSGVWTEDGGTRTPRPSPKMQ